MSERTTPVILLADDKLGEAERAVAVFAGAWRAAAVISARRMSV